jgi:hypothetical protein
LPFPFLLLPCIHGGEGGIRTHGGRKPTPVFETGALIHYATSPQSRQKVKGKGKKENKLFTFLLLPSSLKEILHQRAAIVFQDSLNNFDAMVQLLSIADLKVRFDRARLFVRGTINEKPDARLN